MAVDNYLKEMITAKERHKQLDGLTSTSKTAIWRLMLYIMAFAVEQLAQLFSMHRKEIDNKIATQKTHSLKWIQHMYLNFQYGFLLLDDSDKYDNSKSKEEQVEASKIIKYCAVNESTDGREVIIKIATEKSKMLSPLEAQKMDAIYEYTKRIKGAGVPYRIINYLPDELKLSIRIFRDPLIIDTSGVNILTAEKPVEIALQEFMKELPFNGELRVQDLSNKLEALKGVRLVSVDLALSRWIDASSNSYGDWQTIDVRKIPESGYFKIINFDGISYEV